MKEYDRNKNIIEGALFADKILKFILIPLLLGVAIISHFKGIPYPVIPITIVVVTFYLCAQISKVLLKKSLYPIKVHLIRLTIYMLFLVVAIHYTGGIESPLFVLFAMVFIMAVTVFPLKQTIFIFTLAGILYLGEIWLEYYGVIPHIHIFNSFRPNVFQDTAYILIFSMVIVALLVGMTILAGYLSKLLNVQFEELSRAKAYGDNLIKELKEAKATLEERVEERTRELGESEEKYRNIVEKAFDGIYILQDNVLKFANKRFEVMLGGYTAEELEKTDFRELVAPESRELVSKRELGRLRGEEIPENYEFMGLQKDGEKIDVEIYTTLINYKGRPANQGYVRDITERKKIEDELEKTRDFLGGIIESSIDGIATTDNRGVITFISKGAEDMLGYKREEITGTPISRYYLKGIEDAREIMGALREKGRLQNHEMHLIAKDGRAVPIITSASLLRNEKGEVIGTLGIVKDITEKKRLEDEIREAKDFLENIIESSIDGITTLDKDGKITYLTRGSEEMLGYEKGEVIGSHISRYYAGGMEEARKIANILLERGRVYNYEAVGVTKDGTHIPLILSVSPLRDGKGDIIGTLGIYKDIRERKRLEEEIKRRNEEMQNFVYTVSHDLRSPLLALRSFASLLVNDYKDKINERGQHYLGRIEENAKYMDTLIQELLELSRAGRVVDVSEEVDSSKIIESVIEGLRLRLEEKGIDLVLSDHYPTIYCDRNRIYQVFENLINNSIKFMVDTKNPTIEIGYSDKGRVYEFYVKDNGIGIEKEHHEKIFRIFQRLGDSVEGTGVGLAIVKRIVENHGGNIRVESEKRKGATFYFTLPKSS